MSTLLSRLQDAARHGLSREVSVEAAEAEAAARAAAAFEARAQVQFLQCQNLAIQKLRVLNPRPRIQDRHYRVVVLSERVLGSKTPLTDRVEALFRAEGVQTDRCYGGDEIHTDCELILLIPIASTV